MEQTPDPNAPAGPSASAEKDQQAPVPLEYRSGPRHADERRKRD